MHFSVIVLGTFYLPHLSHFVICCYLDGSNILLMYATWIVFYDLYGWVEGNQFSHQFHPNIGFPHDLFGFSSPSDIMGYNHIQEFGLWFVICEQIWTDMYAMVWYCVQLFLQSYDEILKCWNAPMLKYWNLEIPESWNAEKKKNAEIIKN